jgi:hypothetical protein
MASQRVVEAVNYLIEAPNYAALINEITKIIETWDTHPMVYGGKLTCLNALIDVGLQNREAFERVVKLIEEKRRLLPKIRRVDYQRDLMRERRARMAKALELHEALHGQLRGAARMAQMQAIQDRWAKARDNFLAGKGEMNFTQRNDAIREFWEGIDRNLDKNLADARKERKVKCA